VLLVGCGRIGFDPPTRSGDAIDTTYSDAMTVPAGPAVWLRMETDPNTGIIDSGGGHTVTCAGSCPTQVSGKRGMGYAFVMNQVNVAPASDVDPSAGFTAAIWVYFSAYPTGAHDACPWNKAIDNPSGKDTFALCVTSGGFINYDCETQTGTSASETSPSPISLNQWHHIAMSWDGTNKHDWLDGVEVAGGSIPIGAANVGMALGASRSDYYTDGSVDEAIYYTRALSAEEIAQLAAP
jgi:hypothetical protein